MLDDVPPALRSVRRGGEIYDWVYLANDDDWANGRLRIRWPRVLIS